jgi:hypothetical protein
MPIFCEAIEYNKGGFIGHKGDEFASLITPIRGRYSEAVISEK